MSHAIEYALAALATVAAGMGIGGASFLYYYRPELIEKMGAMFRPAYTVLFNKYWVDELYDLLFVRPLIRVSNSFLYRIVDTGLIDGFGVNGTARAVRGVADRGIKFLQTGLTQSYLMVMLIATIGILAYLMGDVL